MYPYILLSNNGSKSILGDLINVIYLALKTHNLEDVIESKLPYSIFFYNKEISYNNEIFKNFPNLSKCIELVDYETYTFLKSNPEIKEMNYFDITYKNLYKIKNVKYLNINSVNNYSKIPLLEYPKIYKYIFKTFDTFGIEDAKDDFNFDEDIFIDMTNESLYKSKFYINGIKDILDSKNEGIVCEIKCDGQCKNNVKKKVKVHIFNAKSSIVKVENFGDYTLEFLTYENNTSKFYAFQNAKYMILDSPISYYGALCNKNPIENIIAICFSYEVLNSNFVGEKFIESFNMFQENIEIYKDKNFYYFNPLIRPEFLIYTDLNLTKFNV